MPPLSSLSHVAVTTVSLCPGKNTPRLRALNTVLTCAGSGDHWTLRELPRPRVPGPECPNIARVARVPGTQGDNSPAIRWHRDRDYPPPLAAFLRNLRDSRAVNEDLFMFGMDSSWNGPKNSDGSFIVVWDNINNPDILQWPGMWHWLHWGIFRFEEYCWKWGKFYRPHLNMDTEERVKKCWQLFL